MDIINLAFVETRHNVNKVEINPLTFGKCILCVKMYGCARVYGLCTIQSIWIGLKWSGQ